MATSDKRAALMASLGVTLVAITAAVISFSHVRTVAIRAGETELTSWLLPISIDGAVVAAVSVLLADSRAGRQPGLLTWLLLTLGISASLAANIASAEPTAVARAVAAWPPLALALGIEVLAGLARRSDHGRAEETTELRPWPTNALGGMPSNGNGATPSRQPADGSPGILPVRPAANANGRNEIQQPEITDGDAVQRIRELDAAAPAGRASRLEIQKTLGCGGSRAARLAKLARPQAVNGVAQGAGGA